jgi:hypothetical protein
MGNSNFAIATGTGRCGTQFLARLLKLSPGVATRHDPNPFNATFHRYAKWFNLPIDPSGFLSIKRHELDEDLVSAQLSVHSSAHMALSIEELYQHFQCKVIMLYRHPADVVNSYLGKGYYAEEVVFATSQQAPGYHAVGSQPHHFFGRLLPRPDYLESWKKLTRVGKVAWMWATINYEMERQSTSINQTHLFTSRLEDFDYNRYTQLCAFLGIDCIQSGAFQDLRQSRPNRLSTSDVHKVSDWTELERKEFIVQVGSMAAKLGYDLNFERLIARELKQTSSHRADVSPSLLKRIAKKVGL